MAMQTSEFALADFQEGWKSKFETPNLDRPYYGAALIKFWYGAGNTLQDETDVTISSSSYGGSEVSIRETGILSFDIVHSMFKASLLCFNYYEGNIVIFGNSQKMGDYTLEIVPVRPLHKGTRF